jgi:hypothetical protein
MHKPRRGIDDLTGAARSATVISVGDWSGRCLTAGQSGAQRAASA